MAFQRVTLSTIRSQLLDQLNSSGVFWSEPEVDRAINEAVAVWQLLAGEKVITITQSTTVTTANLINITTGHSAGRVLSPIRVSVGTSPSLREMPIAEADAGLYGWRTETAATTTQRPEFWMPLGIDKMMVYPRTGATITFNILGLADATPMASDSAYIDLDEGHLQRVINFAKAILAFKQGVVEGTDNAKAPRELFLTAARDRNVELTKTGLYKNYMGGDQGVGEPDLKVPGAMGEKGVRR